jgi:COX assembly protein 1
MAAMAAENPQVPAEKLGVPSRNPLPLSASQEAQVRDIFYQKVRKECADEIKGVFLCNNFMILPLETTEPRLRDLDFMEHPSLTSSAFAACALNRTFTVSFACRAEHRVMNSCMKLHATQSAHDEAREEWFALRIERQRERERKARVAHAQEDFMREWWGLPEHVRLSRQKEMEQRGERIHGLTAKDLPREKGQ